MKKIELRPGTRQVIGRAGEKGTVQVYADVRDWTVLFPGGAGSYMTVCPDGRRVPVTAELDTEGRLAADVPDELMAVPGVYAWTAVWAIDGTQLLKGPYACVVLGSALRHPCQPQPVPDWAEDIFTAAEEITGKVGTAQEAANAAAQSALNAQEASGSASQAKELCDDYKDAAAGSAQAAQEAAAVAATHNYGISVSENTLIITPPTE